MIIIVFIKNSDLRHWFEFTCTLKKDTLERKVNIHNKYIACIDNYTLIPNYDYAKPDEKLFF